MLQSVCNCQSVHGCRQHTDLVGTGALHFTRGAATPEVAAANHNCNLRPFAVRQLNALANFLNRFHVQPETLLAGKCLAAELEKDSMIFDCHDLLHRQTIS